MSSDAATPVLVEEHDHLTSAIRQALALAAGSARQVTFLVPLFSDGTTGLPVPTGTFHRDEGAFRLSPVQVSIMSALEGRALKVTRLAEVTGAGRRLYDEPGGGLLELKRRGIVQCSRGLGYWRPDAPPPEIEAMEPVEEIEEAILLPTGTDR